MKAVIFSDVHLVERDDPVQGSFASWLDGLDVDELIMLGDVVHQEWGHWSSHQPEHGPTVAALRRVHRRGISIRVVPGDHDYDLGPFFERKLKAEVRESHPAVLAGHSCFLAHGDEVVRSMGYRAAMRFFQGSSFRMMMGSMGAQAGTFILERMAGASQENPVDVGPLHKAQRKWARQLHQEGAQVVVMGHMKRASLEVWDSGCFVQLGDWLDKQTWLAIDDDGIELRCLERGRIRCLGSWKPK